EALVIVRAGGIDAFAAAVGEADGAAAADEVWEPARKVAAGHVAVAARLRPARHQPHGDRVLRARQHGARRLLEIEQAEIVLAALAYDGLQRRQRRLGVEALQRPVALACRVARGGWERAWPP